MRSESQPCAPLGKPVPWLEEGSTSSEFASSCVGASGGHLHPVAFIRRRGGEKEGEMERERVRGGGWGWPGRERERVCVNV